jgi:iron transport multicopper oxidase
MLVRFARTLTRDSPTNSIQGLAVVFAEDPAGMVSGPKSIIIPPEWLELCPAYHALPPEKQ